MLNQVSASHAVRIVEYDHSYAAAVAHMWNLSNESWGGGSSWRTAESVVQDVDNSINLHVFLAVDGDQVVGFCSFSHYMMDEGALYVPLLNVRPDYHNRKVGKALILNAVAKTVEMGWPRLDLFTWSGNTKAVPMYKKCGFFWEKKDDSVHLMNYIPTVLQTEALQPYLQHIDWYADSTRPIEIKPDGVQQSGKFDLFSYSWRKNDMELRVDFEKSGRGIHTLDTPDYEIRTEVLEHDLIFGRTYPVRYHIRSKTGKPVVCEIVGYDDKNIRFSLNRTVTVAGSAVVEGEFLVEPVQDEQSDWKTHPVVLSQWRINGLRAEFRTGIAPKSPAKVTMVGQDLEQYIGVTEVLYLNIENQIPEAAEFRWQLPAASFIQFDQPEIAVQVAAAGKTSVAVPYVLSGFGVYSVVVPIQVITESGEKLAFEQSLSHICRGLTGRFSGEDHKHAYAGSGANMLVLNKQLHLNELQIRRTHFHGAFFWNYPRLGKPYSAEFTRRKPERIRFDRDQDAQIIEALYHSEDFPGISLTAVARIQDNGLIEHYYVVGNQSGEATPESLQLQEAFRFEPNRMVLPYDGSYLDLQDAHAGHMEHWEPHRISENWLFSRGDKLTYGVTWDEGQTLVRCEWLLALEHPLGGLADGGTLRTNSTWVAVGSFANWWDFRSYARKQRESRIPALADHLELRVNNGNPLLSGNCAIEIIDRKLNSLTGRLTVSNDADKLAVVELAGEDNKHSVTVEQPALEPGAVKRITLTYEGSDVRSERSAAVFALSQQPVVKERMVNEGGGETLQLSNGLLKLQVTPAFGNSAHSLIFNEQEWLDTSYPVPGPRSWWNPWTGGIGLELQGMSPLSLQQESRSGEFVFLADSLGNNWCGIRLTLQVEQHERNRGLTVDQYYLLMPGAPVLAKVNRISNRTGLSHPRFHVTDRNFFLPGAPLTTGWMEAAGVGDTRFRIATNEEQLSVRGHLRLGSDQHQDQVHVVFDAAASAGFAYTNNLLLTQGLTHWLTLPEAAVEWTRPSFYIFSKQPLQPADLAAWNKIRFDSDRNEGGATDTDGDY